MTLSWPHLPLQASSLIPWPPVICLFLQCLLGLGAMFGHLPSYCWPEVLPFPPLDDHQHPGNPSQISAASLPALPLLAWAPPSHTHIQLAAGLAPLHTPPLTAGSSPTPHQIPRSTYQPPKEHQLLEMTKKVNRWKAEVRSLP